MAYKTEVPEEDNGKRRKSLTFFLILLPSLMMAIDYGDLLKNIGVKLLLLLLQIVIVRNVLEDYYRN